MNNREGQYPRGALAGAVIAALALAACRSADGPVLVLEFRQLPPEATDVAVELISVERRFEGPEVVGGPVAIRYPGGGGRMRIEIDRAHLAGRSDRLTLPLAVPQPVAFRAEARAMAGISILGATIEASASPGQSLTLLLDIVRLGPDGAPPPGSDAGSAAPVDGAAVPRDGGALDVGAAEAAAEVPRADGPVPPDVPTLTSSCQVSPLQPASVSRPATDPTIVFAAPYQTFFWVDGDRVLYNAIQVDELQLRQRGGDLAVVTPTMMGTTTLRTPRGARVGGNIHLAVGRADSTGPMTGVFVRTVLPMSGSSGGGRWFPGMPGEAPELAAATADGADRMLVVSRGAGANPSPVRLDLMGPMTLPVRTLDHPALAHTRAAGGAWVNDLSRFAVAWIIDSAATGGMMATFQGDLVHVKTFPFTAGTDRPAIGVAGATLSVAGGAGDRAAVAWIGAQGCPGCTTGRELFVTLLAPGTGQVLGQAAVTADGSAPKLFPRVVFDGQSYAVLWSEYASTTNSRVRLRRYGPALEPLGPILDVGAGGPALPVGAADIAVEARSRYGVVMPLFTERHHFTRIVCDGP